MGLQIVHTPEQGTVLEGTGRGGDVIEALRAAGMAPLAVVAASGRARRLVPCRAPGTGWRRCGRSSTARRRCGRPGSRWGRRSRIGGGRWPRPTAPRGSMTAHSASPSGPRATAGPPSTGRTPPRGSWTGYRSGSRSGRAPLRAAAPPRPRPGRDPRPGRPGTGPARRGRRAGRRGRRGPHTAPGESAGRRRTPGAAAGPTPAGPALPRQ